jgi:molybdopterin/thiamine biosynthesis adenylyltransferase
LNSISCFTTAFHRHGFSLFDIANPDRDIIYQGTITTKQFGLIYIKFVFDDGAIAGFPDAYVDISSQDKISPYHFPHLDKRWFICYHDNSLIFDLYKPDQMVEFCIQSVIDVFDNNTLDDMNEISKEFPSYWDNRYSVFGVLVDDDDYAYIYNNWYIGNNNILKIKTEDRPRVSIYRIEKIPSIHGINWPLENYSDFKVWLYRDYQKTVREIEKNVKTQLMNYVFEITIIIYISSSNCYLGIKFNFLDPIVHKQKRQVLKENTVILTLGRRHEVIRFNIDNYDVDRFIKANDIENEISLMGRRILLIGAGTIGSNLANLLVRNGAGSGKDGILVIVDNDRFNPYNFSRHFLGIDASGFNKSIALKDELFHIAPFANIVSENRGIQEVGIKGYEIIIDSTGEEPLTIWLNETLRETNYPALFVSVWIKGKGDAAECFSMTNEKGACHECYRRSPHYLLPEKGQLPLRDSCMSIFVPFPVTASLYASLLVMYVLRNHLTNDSSISMFYRQQLVPVNIIEEHIINYNMGCPLCGKNYMTE